MCFLRGLVRVGIVALAGEVGAAGDQAGAAFFGLVGPAPLDEDEDSVPVSDEEEDDDSVPIADDDKDVDEEPGEPGDESGDVDLAEFGDGGGASDGGEGTFVPVVEGLPRG